MKTIRLRLMMVLYDGSSRLYAQLFKRHKKPWGIGKMAFLAYPPGTLGAALGVFYAHNGFDVMPKLENHDVFHVLTETGTAIQDEIAMQYLLLGNGKISLYLLAMIGIGTSLYPEHFRYFIQSFRKGKACQPFHGLEFSHLLEHPLSMLQGMLIAKTATIHL